MSNDHWLARIELAEARANAAEAERDRYWEALRAIGQLPWCETCAPGYNLIVGALLDGEA